MRPLALDSHTPYLPSAQAQPMPSRDEVPRATRSRPSLMTGARWSSFPELSKTGDEAAQVGRARTLLAVALVGTVAYLLLDVVAQSLPPHYSPVSQQESDLAVGPYGFIMTINFINRGILSLCFLFGMALTIGASDSMGVRFRRGAYLFAAWAVGALLLAAFPTDVGGAQVTWHGAVHLVIAVVAFIGGALGSLYMSLGMLRVPSVERARSLALPISVAAVGLCTVELLGGFFVPHLYARYGGVTERAFLASVLVWIGVVSARLIVGNGAELGKPDEPPVGHP